MAHAARLQDLTDELIRAVTGLTPEKNARAFKTSRDAASRTLRLHRYERTNQFQVEKVLAGLSEKFSILNKDALARALEDRLRKLSNQQNTWTPDLLSLLLHLSENPAQKTNLENLDALKQDKAPCALDWNAELAADLIDQNEKDLWNSLDFASSDSEQGETTTLSEDASQQSDHTRHSSFASHEEGVNIDSILVQTDHEGFKAFKSQISQRNHQSNSEVITITELEAVREILHMLHGLPSRLFHDEDLTPNIKFYLSHFSHTGFQDCLSKAADIGLIVRSLRHFCKQEQTVSLLQSFSAAVSNTVRRFGTNISLIERRFVGIKCPTVVSILGVLTEVENIARPLSELVNVIKSRFDRYHEKSFLLLDDLYDRVECAHVLDDEENLSLWGTLFFSCLRTYLKQIAFWMEDGSHDPADETFLVQDEDTSADISTFWQHRYELRRSEDGILQTPIFMRPFAGQILSSGKSIGFIKTLGIEHLLQTDPDRDHIQDSQQQESFPNLSSSIDATSLIPFSTTLSASLTNWLSNKSQHTTTLLRTHILHSCALLPTLSALSTIFLSTNGALFDAFASTLHTHLETLPFTRSATRLLLEEAARTIFADSSYVHPPCISLTLVPPGRDAQRQHRRKGTTGNTASLRNLACVLVHYKPPVRALANVLPASLLPAMQSLSTLLLQLRCAKAALVRARPSHRHAVPSESSIVSETATATKLTNLTRRIHQRALHTLQTLDSHILQTTLSPLLLALSATLSSPAQTPDLDSLIAALKRFTAQLSAQCLLTPAVHTARDAITGFCDGAMGFVGLVREWERVDEKRGGEKEGVEKKMLERLAKVKARQDELRALLIAELKGACRERDGEPGWGVLAERLGW